MFSWAPLRHLTLTGLVGVVVLFAATCLPAHPSGAAPARAAVAPASANDPDTLIGSSAKGGPSALSALEAKMGRTASSHRVFNPGFRSDILADQQVMDDKARGRTTVYSVKLPWAQVAAGTHDAAITRLAQSLKADGRKIFLAFHHEAEGDGDAGLFRTAFARFGRTVKAVGAPNVSVTHILMEWTFNPKSGRQVADWMPPADSFDVLALDVYINPQKADRSFAQATAAGMAEAKRLGKQFAVAEWGVVAKAGDVGARARTIAAGLAHAKANNFEFVCWFHSSIGVNAPPEGWYLDALNDTASVAAFADGMSAGGSVGDNRKYVRALYADLLKRANPADSGGIDYWANRLNTQTRSQVAVGIQKGSTEYYGHLVKSAYQTFLDRDPDVSGRSFYVDAWRARARTLDSIVVALAGSNEYFRSKGSSNAAFIEAVHLDILGRRPSADERSNSLIVVAFSGRATLARILETNVERRRRIVTDGYNTYLRHAPGTAAREYWVGRLFDGMRREYFDVALVASSEYYNAHS